MTVRSLCACVLFAVSIVFACCYFVCCLCLRVVCLLLLCCLLACLFASVVLVFCLFVGDLPVDFVLACFFRRVA